MNVKLTKSQLKLATAIAARMIRNGERRSVAVQAATLQATGTPPLTALMKARGYCS